MGWWTSGVMATLSNADVGGATAGLLVDCTTSDVNRLAAGGGFPCISLSSSMNEFHKMLVPLILPLFILPLLALSSLAYSHLTRRQTSTVASRVGSGTAGLLKLVFSSVATVATSAIHRIQINGDYYLYDYVSALECAGVSRRCRQFLTRGF